MSFEQGRETLETTSSPPTTPNPGADRDSRNENDFPSAPASHHHQQHQLQPPIESSKSGPLSPEARERLEHVLNSDIGLNTLLNRLKQSLSSARDFSSFLKERSALEEKHAQALKRLSKSTHELARRPESRGGTFAQSLEESTKVHDRIADNGLQFAQSLNAMCNELQDMMTNTEKSRKHWKHTGLEAENRVTDAENTMNKAKGKYFHLAEQYDRAKTGEKSGGKFGIKGHKSAAQQEEDLHRKLEAADAEYAAKVQAAQAARQELITTHRPQAVRALQAIIKECDAAVGMQLAKYAGLSERLLLGNGLCVSPLKGQGPGTGRGLREIIQSVDNEKDFNDHVLSFTAKAGPPPADIRYEKHPTMGSRQHMPPQQQPPPFDPSQQPAPYSSPKPGNHGFNNSYDHARQPSQSAQVTGVMPVGGSGDGFPGPPPPQSHFANHQQQPYHHSPTTNNSPLPQLPPIAGLSGGGNGDQRPDQSTPTKSPALQQFGQQGRPSMDPYASQSVPPPGGHGVDPSTTHPDMRGPPSMGPGHPGSRGPSLGQQNDFRSAYAPQPYQHVPPPSDPRGPPPQAVPPQNGSGIGGYGPAPPPATGSNPTGAAALLPSGQRRSDMNRPNLPPLRPVFGISLDELFQRDGSAVPSIVYECVKAVDMFGLDTEGIYRTSGSAPNIMQMKAQFDHDSSQVDFRNPANFHHDIASVTTLLKHFLRDLPDPLFTSESYNQFIQAAKIENDDVRRDSLHAIINNLPDPNYATLRVLTLHLMRVASHADKNRMTFANLAICLGPTFMGQATTPTGQSQSQSGVGNNGNRPLSSSADIKDAGWQARVVETILNHGLEIFDDD